jgi:hypothetical protein
MRSCGSVQTRQPAPSSLSPPAIQALNAAVLGHLRRQGLLSAAQALQQELADLSADAAELADGDEAGADERAAEAASWSLWQWYRAAHAQDESRSSDERGVEPEGAAGGAEQPLSPGPGLLARGDTAASPLSAVHTGRELRLASGDSLLALLGATGRPDGPAASVPACGPACLGRLACHTQHTPLTCKGKAYSKRPIHSSTPGLAPCVTAPPADLTPPERPDPLPPSPEPTPPPPDALPDRPPSPTAAGHPQPTLPPFAPRPPARTSQDGAYASAHEQSSGAAHAAPAELSAAGLTGHLGGGPVSRHSSASALGGASPGPGPHGAASWTWTPARGPGSLHGGGLSWAAGGGELRGPGERQHAAELAGLAAALAVALPGLLPALTLRARFEALPLLLVRLGADTRGPPVAGPSWFCASRTYVGSTVPILAARQ